MGIYRMKVEHGVKPSEWPAEHFANVGSDEEFVKRFTELPTIVDAGTIQGQQREDVKHAILNVLMEGLVPAFSELQQIRTASPNLPLMNRCQLYEGLAGKLWKAYKDLTQKAVRAMGFDIGFMFTKKDFKEGLENFRKQNPKLRDSFDALLINAREKWQNDLAKFRNNWIEHQSGSQKQFQKFYTQEYAEELFDNVWRTIADIIPVLLETRLPFEGRLIERSHDDGGPPWPQRFQFHIPGFNP